MKTLKKTIHKYMYQLTFIFVIIILLVVLYVLLRVEQKRAYENSMQTFMIINNRLEENEAGLAAAEEEYRQTCLHNAEIVARILDDEPELQTDRSSLIELAESLEIDEIHIFDATGRIVAGTHPEYYDYTFDSGEQMWFFKPMLEDKSLQLVQDITPNTAENKLMQYSAIWNKSGEYIVQIGMEPINIQQATEKNEMSYVFSSIKMNAEAAYYGFDADTGIISGSTNTASIGNSIESLGLDLSRIKSDSNGFHASVNGEWSFCCFKQEGDIYLGRIVSIRMIYQRVPLTMLIISVCLLVMYSVLTLTVMKHIDRYVVDEIHDINDKLKLITNGDLHQTFDVKNSLEFHELSTYLNAMLKSILDNNVKMAHVLNKTNLLIGIYEYNDAAEKVRYTEYVPQIFSLSAGEMETLASDISGFQQFIEKLHTNIAPQEPNVYMVGEKYIKLDEIQIEADTFGVVMDVTAEIQKQKKLEIERDIDLLTGLLNRRGLETQIAALFVDPDSIGYYALVMIDADGLKKINDTYGHDSGDCYIRKIGSLINHFGLRDSICARLGGDEFVLFLYSYDSELELEKTLETLEFVQSNSYVRINKNTTVPLLFSFGYCLSNGAADYQKLLKQADEKMYQNKLERRAQRGAKEERNEM